MAFVDYNELDGSQKKPVESFLNYDDLVKDQRGIVKEVGTQLYAGATVDLPKMVGQAMQWMGSEDKGKSLAEWAAEREKANPDFAPQVEGAGIVRRALSGGARALAPSVATMLPAALTFPFGGVAGVAAAGISSFGLFGASQAQETYDKLKAAGVNDDDAKKAGYINLLIEGGGETIGTIAGYKLLGLGAKAIGASGMTPVQAAIKGATERAVWLPFAKQLPKTLAVEAGTEFGQNFGETAVEKSYGLKEGPTPFEAGAQGFEAALGMTVLLAPFGLAGFSVRAKRNARVADALENPDAPIEQRIAASRILFDEINTVNPDAAKAWGENSAIAISAKAPIVLDESFAQKKDQTQEIMQAPTVDAAITAALEPVHMDELAGFTGGAIPQRAAELGMINAQIAALTEPAYAQKAQQDESIRIAQETVADAQRARNVQALPEAPFKLTAAEEAELRARIIARAAEDQPAVATGGAGIIGDALANARRSDETQAAYKLRMEAQNAQAVRSDQGQTGERAKVDSPAYNRAQSRAAAIYNAKHHDRPMSSSRPEGAPRKGLVNRQIGKR